MIIGWTAELVIDVGENLRVPNESEFSLLYINIWLKEPIGLG
jgi:hypothetical protein